MSFHNYRENKKLLKGIAWISCQKQRFSLNMIKYLYFIFILCVYVCHIKWRALFATMVYKNNSTLETATSNLQTLH